MIQTSDLALEYLQPCASCRTGFNKRPAKRSCYHEATQQHTSAHSDHLSCHHETPHHFVTPQAIAVACVHCTSHALCMKTWTLANQKGGVGKTTSCVNLASAWSQTGKRILLVDMDPQSNATVGSGIFDRELSRHTGHVLLGEAPLLDTIRTSTLGYDVLPAHPDLTRAEVALLSSKHRSFFLKKRLQALKSYYDLVLIDCPPSLNTLTVNALVAATGVLIPMQCEYYALEGLALLNRTIRGIQQSASSSLQIVGIVRTMYDGRSRLTQEVSDALFQYFGHLVCNTVIPRNVRVAEAPSHGLSVLAYAPRSKGAIAYMTLAGELWRKGAMEP